MTNIDESKLPDETDNNNNNMRSYVTRVNYASGSHQDHHLSHSASLRTGGNGEEDFRAIRCENIWNLGSEGHFNNHHKRILQLV